MSPRMSVGEDIVPRQVASFQYPPRLPGVDRIAVGWLLVALCFIATLQISPANDKTRRYKIKKLYRRTEHCTTILSQVSWQMHKHRSQKLIWAGHSSQYILNLTMDVTLNCPSKLYNSLFLNYATSTCSVPSSANLVLHVYIYQSNYIIAFLLR